MKYGRPCHWPMCSTSVLDGRGSVALDARPAYVFAGAPGVPDAALSAAASAALGREVRAFASAGRVNALEGA